MYLDRIDRKDLSSYYPNYGAIFMANELTRQECFERKLFGLPFAFKDFILRVKSGMLLFLFDYHKRKLYGVFEASSDGNLDLVPDAYESTKSRFPAQVRFNIRWKCAPLSEDVFRDAIAENYFAPNKFNFGLSRDQVDRLLFLFEKVKLKIQRPQMSGRSHKKQNLNLSSVPKQMARSVRKVNPLNKVNNKYQNPERSLLRTGCVQDQDVCCPTLIKTLPRFTPKKLASSVVCDIALPLLEPPETKGPLNYYSPEFDEEIDDSIQYQVPGLYSYCLNPDPHFSAFQRKHDVKDDDKRYKSSDIRPRGLDSYNREKCVNVFQRLSGWPKLIEENGRHGPNKCPARPLCMERSSSENMRDILNTLDNEHSQLQKCPDRSLEQCESFSSTMIGRLDKTDKFPYRSLKRKYSANLKSQSEKQKRKCSKESKTCSKISTVADVSQGSSTSTLNNECNEDPCKTETTMIVSGDTRDDELHHPDALDMLLAQYNEYLSRSTIDDETENVSVSVDGNVKLEDLNTCVGETS